MTCRIGVVPEYEVAAAAAVNVPSVGYCFTHQCRTNSGVCEKGRIAELEAALRTMVYFDDTTVTWRCAQICDNNMTDVVGDVLTVQK